jgi:hypothetical protein
LLSEHPLGLHILGLDDVVTIGFRRGITWERLLAILDWSKDHM